MIPKILTSIIIIKAIQQLLFDLYLLQLKEYRLDRVSEHIVRVYGSFYKGVLKTSLLAPLSLNKFPKPTYKALIIFIICVIIVTIMINFNNVILLVSLLFVTPFIIMIANFAVKIIEWPIRQAIYRLAEIKIDRFKKNYSLITIGVTGSFGKSSTVSYINQVLSAQYQTLATPGSVNTPLAISLLILKHLKTRHRYMIVEMGAYKKGEIEELCKIAKPEIGVITGIGNQHLALFGSQANIISAKSELIAAIPKHGAVFINKNSPEQPELKNCKTKKIYYFGNNKDKNNIAMPFLSDNIDAARQVGLYIGVDGKKVTESITRLIDPKTSPRTFFGKNNIFVINDDHTANLNGVLALLAYLKTLSFRVKIIVMPCIIELGKTAGPSHRVLGRALAQSTDLAIITTADYFSDITTGSENKKNILLRTNTKDILSTIEPYFNDQTLIAIGGRVDKEIISFLKNYKP